MLCAPIVLFETDRPAAYELMFKRENVLDGGASKTIDALVVIPDDAKITVLGGQKRDQQILQMVRILILVYHNVFKTPLPELTPVLKSLQQENGIQNKVVKIHGIGRKKTTAVFSI